jgi:hypothetical protein
MSMMLPIQTITPSLTTVPYRINHNVVAKAVEGLAVTFLVCAAFYCLGVNAAIYAVDPQSVTYPYLPASHATSNTATIGEAATVTIFGYATKYALVFLESTTNLGTTVASGDGEFRFSSLSVPKNTTEICLSYTDSLGRTSASTCIPFSDSYYGYSVGPIVLSPTISLAASTHDLGEEIFIQGFSIPNQPVKLHSFSDKIYSWRNWLTPQKVFAIPPVETTADENGRYEYSLKGQDAQDIRMYTSGAIDNLTSDKSIQLKAEIAPRWLIYLRKLQLVLDTFLGNMKNILLLLELLILYLLTCYYLLPPKERALMLRNSSLLIKATGIMIERPTKLLVRSMNSIMRQNKA